MRKLGKKLILVVFALGVFCSTAFAANGQLVFTHGVRSHYLRGAIDSTEKEASMGIVMNIDRTNGVELTVGNRVAVYNTDGYIMVYNEDGQAGEFSCTYYCGGSIAGRSQAPWEYDFT